MEKQTAGRDNLGKLAPEFAELNDDVLFGEDFFQSFSAIVQSNAASREKGDVVDYNQALDILKKKVSSKYSIRLLMQALGKRNKGNDSNIEYLCQIMDETKSWHLVKDFVPQLNEKAISGHKNNVIRITFLFLLRKFYYYVIIISNFAPKDIYEIY